MATPTASIADEALIAAFYLFFMSVMAIIVPPAIALVAERTGRKPVTLATLVRISIMMAGLWRVGELAGNPLRSSRPSAPFGSR